MFDIGITEIGVIAVVALIVIGPERLPRVARTIGTLLGRAQRYVNDVKAEVNREIELDELKKLQTQMKEAAQSVQQQMTSVGTEVQSAVHDAEKSFQSGIDAVGSEVSSSVKAIEQSVAGSDVGAGRTWAPEPSPAGPAGGVGASEPSPAGPAGSALASGSPEPTAAGPATSFPYSPLEEPPVPVEDAAVSAELATPTPTWSPDSTPLAPPPPPAPFASPMPSPARTSGALRDPRASANLTAVRNGDAATVAANDSSPRSDGSHGAPPAVRRPRLRDPRAAANVAAASGDADRGEQPLQPSLFR